MKLTYFKPRETTNFGDELNSFIWPQLLPPDFLDSDDRELFVGIGSIIYNSYPAQSRKFVVGSGYGGYGRPPNMKDDSWSVIFVRGPRTASILGLQSDSWITDGAVLIREAGYLPAPTPNIGVGFMPHFETMNFGSWQEICDGAGVTLIDPRKPVHSVLADILGARLIVTEAMHGAIVADCLRVPWVPMKPLSSAHHMKWADWTDSLSLSPDWARIGPSNLHECLHNSLHNRVSRTLIKSLKSTGLLTLSDPIFERRAISQLKRAKRAHSFLSRDSVIMDRTRRAKSALDKFTEQRTRSCPSSDNLRRFGA